MRQPQCHAGEIVRVNLTRSVVAGPQFGNALLVDVHAPGIEAFAQRHRERQTDIAEADDHDPWIERLRGGLKRHDG